MKNAAYLALCLVVAGVAVGCLYAAWRMDTPVRYASAAVAGMAVSVLLASLALRRFLKVRQPSDLGVASATVVISQTKAASIIIALLSIGFAASVLLFGQSGIVASGMTWFLFAICVALVPISFVGARNAILTLSPAGLDYSAFRSGTIPWSDIAGASIVGPGRPVVVALEIREPQKYMKGSPFKDPMHFLERRMAHTPFLLPANALRLEPEKLVEAIACRIRAFGAPRGAERDTPTHARKALA